VNESQCRNKLRLRQELNCEGYGKIDRSVCMYGAQGEVFVVGVVVIVQRNISGRSVALAEERRNSIKICL
jgi:hypothetical protein